MDGGSDKALPSGNLSARERKKGTGNITRSGFGCLFFVLVFLVEGH